MENKCACVFFQCKKTASVRFCAALLALLLAPLHCFAFSEADILSPVPGTWKNRQPLVLNLAPETELYYSLTGSDPYLSGFSYDKPVLIDEAGDVTVKITAVLPGGGRKDFTVEYTVDETEFPKETYSAAAVEFLRSVASEPVKKYAGGADFTFPEEFVFSLGNSGIPRFSGSISLSERNTVERYVPCTLADFENAVFFHFVIHVVPMLKEPAQEKRAEKLPFEISGWNSVSFADKKYIYQIDGGNWQPPLERCVIDRSSAHTVRWQPVEYSKANPVLEYVLPARPDIYSQRNGDGTVSFFIDGDPRYSFAGGAPSACADAFPFEDVSSDALLSIYCDGVFQGIAEAPFSIDRLPPEKPEIVRLPDPALSFRSEPGAAVFFSVSAPEPVSEDPDSSYRKALAKMQDDDRQPDARQLDAYQPFSGNSLPLSSGGEEPVFYIVRAYAADAAGNRSGVAERSIVIDDTNYYLCAQADGVPPEYGGLEDGSRERPFSSFLQFSSVLRSSEKKLNLHVYGEVKMPDGTAEITRDCSIIGHGGVLSFGDGSSLSISDGASVSFKGLVLERERESREKPLVSVENAGAEFSGCELSGVFAESGALVESRNACVKFISSGLTVQGELYACAVFSEGSKVSCAGSRVSAVAQASVNFKVSGGTCRLEQSDCYAAGNLCRGIEAVRSSLYLRKNSFFARRAEGAQEGSGILCGDGTQLLLDEENVFRGF